MKMHQVPRLISQQSPFMNFYLNNIMNMKTAVAAGSFTIMKTPSHPLHKDFNFMKLLTSNRERNSCL